MIRNDFPFSHLPVTFILKQMKYPFTLPSRREIAWCFLLWAAYYGASSFIIDYRIEHFFFSGLFLVCFFASALTRKFAVGMIPFIIFGASYDFMRVYPNYLVNEVDIQGIYEAEKSMFGLTVDGNVLTLNEYFSSNHVPFADFMAGLFYLCWVPVPLFFALYLFCSGKRGLFLRFAWAFLFVNLLGFVGYYVHPAAPPWYMAEYGTEPVFDTLGNEAGLCRFDQLMGINFFHDLYSRNANVFAAVPSLHSAYCLTAFLYALIGRERWYVTWMLGFFSLGICWTAVYTSHHYVIDVLLGVFLAIGFVLLWEKFLLRIWPVKRCYEAYRNYVS